MWLRIGNGYLNLETIVDIHFPSNSDGVLTATLETVAGSVEHYKGHEAACLKDALDSLVTGERVGGLLKPPAA
jgi:hypothetical protein